MKKKEFTEKENTLTGAGAPCQVDGQETVQTTEELDKLTEAFGVNTESLESILRKRLELMDKLKVDRLYENQGGEYFTSQNLALLSEGNVRENVATYTRDTILKLIEKFKTA